jgi:hypothetical protein
VRTDELIGALAADAPHRQPSLSAAWWAAAAVAAALAAGVFFALLGPRPDIAAAAETPRFLWKFVITLALAGSAFALAGELSRPGARPLALAWLVAAPVLLAASVAIELALVPPGDWAARTIGTNNINCLTFIPLIGLAPLAIFLVALRYGAPTRPRLAGAVAGLLAGGVAATFYAAHCTDDSPLFVAVWYPLAIAALAALGALAGGRVARW